MLDFSEVISRGQTLDLNSHHDHPTTASTLTNQMSYSPQKTFVTSKKLLFKNKKTFFITIISNCRNALRTQSTI